jgi:hypothetical protein
MDSPGFLCNGGAGNAFGFERGDNGRQVVAHQVKDCANEMTAPMELAAVGIGLSGMNAGFGGRQSEDQPSASSVHCVEIEHVAKEGAIGFWVVAVQEYVGTDDHGEKL